MGLSRPLFVYFCLLNVVQLTDNFFLPMFGFEQWVSGVGSDRSANCATTSALWLSLLLNQETSGPVLSIAIKILHV